MLKTLFLLLLFLFSFFFLNLSFSSLLSPNSAYILFFLSTLSYFIFFINLHCDSDCTMLDSLSDLPNTGQYM
ncbi:hypothetical protein BY996DRAFT_7296122 [Phakopsora pachyrhizi]|nr:hypothetical protein BY996DRAFT_7296122 [Phakopsora pachyrhizi]